MKNEIVVAIDFSLCSINALEHAVSIARLSKSNVVMVFVHNPHKPQRTIYKYSDPIDEATKLFEELAERFQLTLPNSRLLYRIREGKVYQEVVTEARERKAWLIVAGTHGASGFEEMWIGSNAFRIVTNAHCPVITIREGVHVDRELRRIVLPIDRTLETRQKVPLAAKLAKLFGAEIHVLATYAATTHEVMVTTNHYAQQAIQYIENEGVKVVKGSVKGKDLLGATIGYAQKVDANLIIIMTEQETKLSGLILGPYAQQMINRSPFPVMCVHNKELIRVLTA
jgi:nucleotide-binding universal stress UspA family protein